MSHVVEELPLEVREEAINAITAESLLEHDRGMGEESDLVKDYLREMIDHYFFEPISRQEADPSVRFLMLKDRWEAETAFLSSITHIAMHPAYQEIIGMGLPAVPLILAEMERKPGHWFWALRAMTGIDPTLPEDRGNVRRMTKSWLLWGRERGYLSE
jgi:hypothetical protein